MNFYVYSLLADMTCVNNNVFTSLLLSEASDEAVGQPPGLECVESSFFRAARPFFISAFFLVYPPQIQNATEIPPNICRSR